MPGKGSLTGGTGDVNPQWYKFTLTDPTAYTASAAGSATTTAFLSQAFPIPINRLRTQGQKATVIEILKIRWQFGVSTNAGQTVYGGGPVASNHYAGGGTGTNAFLTTKAYSSPPGGSEGPIIDEAVFETFQTPQVTALDPTAPPYFGQSAGGSLFETPPELYHDLTDGDGHGIIVATDNVYLSMNTEIVPMGGSFGNSGSGFYIDPFVVDGIYLYCWLLYRFKDVSLTEYIGVVQSQQ
jgi:hypothetical protein